MPILKHAKKKLLVDAKRAEANKKVRTAMRKIIKKFKTTPGKESLREVFSVVDRAAKKFVIKKGKADRIKSRLSKSMETRRQLAQLDGPASKQAGKVKKTVKKAVKK